MNLSQNYSRMEILDASYEIATPAKLKEWSFLDKISGLVVDSKSIVVDLLNVTY